MTTPVKHRQEPGALLGALACGPAARRQRSFKHRRRLPEQPFDELVVRRRGWRREILGRSVFAAAVRTQIAAVCHPRDRREGPIKVGVTERDSI